MHDALAFLKNNYTEEEAKTICQKVEAVLEFSGSYYTHLLKTTKDITYTSLKPEFRSQEKRYKLLMKFKAEQNVENINEILNEDFQKKFDLYYKELGAYEEHTVPKDTYVLLSRINTGVEGTIATLLEKMTVPYYSVEGWWDDKFSESDFIEIEVESLKDACKTLYFIIDGNYTKKGIVKLHDKLLSEIVSIGLASYRVYQNYLVKTPFELKDIVIKKKQYIFKVQVLTEDKEAVIQKVSDLGLAIQGVIVLEDEDENFKLPVENLEFIKA